MNTVRASSSLDLVHEPSNPEQQYDDSALEGVAAHVKLLLKLIQDYKDACGKEKNDSRRMLRVATMMTILDNIRGRIQQCQSFGNKRSRAELRRCNTDIRHRAPRPDKELVGDDQDTLRRELSASISARKSLQIMCTSLGREKEIMATELQRKVQELSGMEEYINDLKAQNEKLLEKVQECALEHKEKRRVDILGGGETRCSTTLQERNKSLSEQLLRSLDGYRAIKRKLKKTEEQNAIMRSTMDKFGAKVVPNFERIRNFKEYMMSPTRNDASSDNEEEIETPECVFECFNMLVTKHDMKQGGRAETNAEISACKPSILA